MSKFKTEDELKQAIEDNGYEDVVIFSNPDYASAFIGISEDNRAVYDYNRMINHLMVEDGMTDIEAIEFIEFNTVRSLPYAGSEAPIIVYDLY